MVPVNLRPANESPRLGNRFGLVPLVLPVGLANPLERLYDVRRRMDELKGGYQAPLAYALLSVVGQAPRVLQSGILDYLASTSTTGLSDAYQAFCVASEGYREFFIRKGVRPEKIVVTGIPNFDDAVRFHRNTFRFRGYVLVATSDTRETFKPDDRKAFIRRALGIAAGRPIIFKLHPNENDARSRKEIYELAPRALVLTDGNIGEMIANCDALITQYSSVAFIGLALGKEVHSYFDLDLLRRLLPLQNNGTSNRHIASVCRRLLETETSTASHGLAYAQAGAG